MGTFTLYKLYLKTLNEFDKYNWIWKCDYDRIGNFQEEKKGFALLNRPSNMTSEKLECGRHVVRLKNFKSRRDENRKKITRRAVRKIPFSGTRSADRRVFRKSRVPRNFPMLFTRKNQPFANGRGKNGFWPRESTYTRTLYVYAIKIDFMRIFDGG